ncbi:MAG: DUF502 domain-containing protein [Candidatus Omnitrophica bacterium]|nr:DUF502 domain-containing protein [Candidatus Omnitrophota bacterium]
MFKYLKRQFITGLVVLGPISLTVYFLVLVFQFADNILGQFLNVHLKKAVGFYIPGIGFLLFVSIILLAGMIANRFLGRKIVHATELWFHNLPIIKAVYPTFSQIFRFILQQKEFGFKKVVLVEYPSKGIWSIGFITNDQFENVNKACQGDMVAVFVPNTPGPLAGYVVFVPKENVRAVDMPVSDAIKIIISGGVFKSQEPTQESTKG